jgi:S-formylglutathione hydrolase FrmB
LSDVFGRDHRDVAIDPDDLAVLLRGDEPSDRSPTLERWREAGTGAIVDVAIPADRSGFHTGRARVWLPPAFLDHPHRSRPVAVMVGGTPSTPADWTRAGRLDRTASAVASQLDGEAPVFVMVDVNGSWFADTECVDGPRGNAETYLADDVPDFVRTLLEAPGEASAWAIVGYSAGGTCALTVGLRHPEVFGTIVDLAGDERPNLGSQGPSLTGLYRGDRAAMELHDPRTLIAQAHDPIQHIWFAAGREDRSHLAIATDLASAAEAAAFDVTLDVGSGGHDYGFVANEIRIVVPWLAETLRSPG